MTEVAKVGFLNKCYTAHNILTEINQNKSIRELLNKKKKISYSMNIKVFSNNLKLNKHKFL